MAVETVVSAVAATAEEAAGNMKKHSILRNLMVDLVCAGLALVVFALFHHVLPRQQQSLGIAISNSAISSSAEPIGAIASANTNDVSSPPASGTLQSNSYQHMGNSQSGSDQQNDNSQSSSRQSSSNRQSSSGQQNSSSRGSRSGKGGKGNIIAKATGISLANPKH